jgi:hypothetical protein
VVHGPEIIDSGAAAELINYLSKLGPVTAVLGGTMGRVALIDAGLQDLIAVRARSRPSQSIQDLDASCDMIFLLNQAKTRESGLSFGVMVAEASGRGKPLFQIDYGGRFVASLRKDAKGEEGDDEEKNLAEQIASELGLDVLKPPHLKSFTAGNNTVMRSISGVCPGELVTINGTVIGRARERRVEIAVQDGKIVGMTGVQPKQHGLDKISGIDLMTAIIRSGSIRRNAAVGRRHAVKSNENGTGKVAVFIDHCAEDAFEKALGAGAAVTVGDDTTAVAGDILARLGIPVIGIVDGDLDRLSGCTSMTEGSVVFRVEPGNDDLVGSRIKAEIFKGEKKIPISFSELANKVKEIASSHLVAIESINSVSF